MKDWKTTLSGFLTLGLTMSSFLVKNPDTKSVLQALAVAVGSGGLMVAKDGGTSVSAPPTPSVTISQPAVVTINDLPPAQSTHSTQPTIQPPPPGYTYVTVNGQIDTSIAAPIVPQVTGQIVSQPQFAAAKLVDK